MILVLILCALGLMSGFLLMIRVPTCRSFQHLGPELTANPLLDDSVAIIVPARNEERNLAQLLASIPSDPKIAEIVVVDDDSTDRTASVAEQFRSRVVIPGMPPPGFTGKTWACAEGARRTSARDLFFLDADTFFVSGGCESILEVFAEPQPKALALSVLPFVITKRPYEELSLFFNLLMAFGAGGFGIFQSPRLFGQSLLLSRELYQAIGGHSTVSRHVLENFHLWQSLQSVNAESLCLGGRGALCMRMFPDGFAQLWYGWIKGFASGAKSTDPRILFVSIVWLTALATSALLLLVSSSHLRPAATLLYLFGAGQVFYYARQIGSFRFISCLLFPVPLLFFFVLFGQSAVRRATRRSTIWRGREV